MLIYVVRHGQSVYNQEDRHQGWRDVPLSARGERQARATGERLKAVKFDFIFSSPIKRCYDTCAAIVEAQGRPLTDIQRHDGLREARVSAALEGQLDADIIKARSDEENYRASHDVDFSYPDGESIRGVFNRAVAAYEEILGLDRLLSNPAEPLNPDEKLAQQTGATDSLEERSLEPALAIEPPRPKTALIVTHAITSQMIALYTLGVGKLLMEDPTLILRLDISNCGISLLSHNERSYQALYVNEVSHLRGIS